MGTEFSSMARRLGIFSAGSFIILGIAYAITLVIGFLSLKSPQQPIGDPMFSILEVIIIVMTPMMLSLVVSVHAWAPPHAKVFSMVAVIFMSLAAGLTCCVHFAILTLTRTPAFSAQPLLPLLLSFKWPSLAYALDILAWDFFFALSMLFAAPVFAGSRLAKSIRMLMTASGGLAIAGLSGVVAGDMQLRNIGIVGYLGLFLLVAFLLLVLFFRTEARI